MAYYTTLCDHCSKPIPDNGAVCLSIVARNPSHHHIKLVEHGIHLNFHAECFLDVAGDEYILMLQQKYENKKKKQTHFFNDFLW